MWGSNLKKTAADRFLTPKIQDDKDSSFATAPYAKCTDDTFEDFFNESQLIKNHGSTKYLNLDKTFFESPLIELKNINCFPSLIVTRVGPWPPNDLCTKLSKTCVIGFIF